MDTWGNSISDQGAASAKALGQHELGSFQRHREANVSGRVSEERAGGRGGPSDTGPCEPKHKLKVDPRSAGDVTQRGSKVG